MNFKYHFLKFCFSTNPTKRVTSTWQADATALQDDSFSFLHTFPSAHLHLSVPSCLALELQFSVAGVVLLLRVRLHLTHWCPCPALVFPAANSNTNKNEFNNTSGTAVSTSHSADAYDYCCLHVQTRSSRCNSSCMHIYAHITLTTMLHVTGDLGLYSFQRRAKRYSLSQQDAQPEETHFARSGQTAKMVLVVFCLQLHFAFL